MIFRAITVEVKSRANGGLYYRVTDKLNEQAVSLPYDYAAKSVQSWGTDILTEGGFKPVTCGYLDTNCMSFHCEYTDSDVKDLKDV